MTPIEKAVYDYITKNPFSKAHKHLENNNDEIICIKLKISKNDFQKALDGLVQQDKLKKEKVAEVWSKDLNKVEIYRKNVVVYS